jgi:hypothetical protein
MVFARNASLLTIAIGVLSQYFKLGRTDWVPFWQQGRCLGLFQYLMLVMFSDHCVRLLESGFIPGSLYTLSCWYKNSELSRRFGFFFLGNGVAQACGGLIAYGVYVITQCSSSRLTVE